MESGKKIEMMHIPDKPDSVYDLSRFFKTGRRPVNRCYDLPPYVGEIWWGKSLHYGKSRESKDRPFLVVHFDGEHAYGYRCTSRDNPFKPRFLLGNLEGMHDTYVDPEPMRITRRKLTRFMCTVSDTQWDELGRFLFPEKGNGEADEPPVADAGAPSPGRRARRRRFLIVSVTTFGIFPQKAIPIRWISPDMLR